MAGSGEAAIPRWRFLLPTAREAAGALPRVRRPCTWREDPGGEGIRWRLHGWREGAGCTQHTLACTTWCPESR
eukprot:9697609-Heterocapsa_arctica.AAC.1